VRSVARLGQKALLLVTVFTMLAALAGIADAASKKETTKGNDAAPAKSKPTTDFAKGKGVDTVGEMFKFSAENQSSDPTTDDSATGKFTIKYGKHRKFFDKGEIQCLEATSGGGANFVGQASKSNGGDNGVFFTMDAFDSGQPKGQGDTFNQDYSSTPLTCHAPTSGGDTLRKGNIVVHAMA
jgi:hypothetical protein